VYLRIEVYNFIVYFQAVAVYCLMRPIVGIAVNLWRDVHTEDVDREEGREQRAMRHAAAYIGNLLCGGLDVSVPETE